MTNNKLNYKYQASFFFNGDKQDQLVIRSDEKKEFEEMLKWVKAIKEAKNGSNSAQKPAQGGGEARICEKCGSEMWDNRPKKASGEFSKKSPDFKCKNKDCEFVIWPKKKQITRAGGGR